MLRRAGLFNPIRQIATQSIKVVKPPVTSDTGRTSLTSMQIEGVYLGKDDKPTTFEVEYVIPHDRVTSFSGLLATARSLAKTNFENAAMVVLANKEWIPPTQTAVDQIREVFKPFHGLTPYSRVELKNLFNERQDTAERIASTPSLLTKFY